MKKALKIINQISIAICCLFLFTQCDEVRYINEADIPNIKPGGVVNIRITKPNNEVINLVSECALLGVRKTNVSYGGEQQDRANFQTVGKSENLILSIDFTIKNLVTIDSAVCRLQNIQGSFSQNNTNYLIDYERFNTETSTTTFTNLEEKGKPSSFRLSSSVRGTSGLENWLINFQSNLLP
jgi:hypothetical protein